MFPHQSLPYKSPHQPITSLRSHVTFLPIAAYSYLKGAGQAQLHCKVQESERKRGNLDINPLKSLVASKQSSQTAQLNHSPVQRSLIQYNSPDTQTKKKMELKNIAIIGVRTLHSRPPQLTRTGIRGSRTRHNHPITGNEPTHDDNPAAQLPIQRSKRSESQNCRDRPHATSTDHGAHWPRRSALLPLR